MLEGETIATGAIATCLDCKINLVLQVLRSAAGYYIGTQCECGPYSRESGYYRTERDAQNALETGMFGR